MADKILGMNNDQSWVEALNISPEMLVEWSSQAPAAKPLLVHCLEEGHISVPDYMAWACDHYGMAVLSARYFQEALDTDSLASHRSTGQWQPWCYPVEQWDGITFVACVEPPQEHADPHVRFVLADPRAMREAWGDPITSVSAFVPAAPPTESIDIPDGMKLNSTKPFVLNLDESQLLFSDNPPSPPNLLFSENSEVSHVPIHAMTPTEASSPAPLKAPSRSKAGATGGKQSLPVDEDAACAAVFKSLKVKYSNAFIMKCSATEARLYKWDANLTPSEEALSPISLSLPTFFRIVAKTLLPYHGYLIESPAHGELFAALGIQKIPACVTAVPLKLNGGLWGILVAIGQQDLQSLEALRETESLCEQLLQTLGPIWGKAA